MEMPYIEHLGEDLAHRKCSVDVNYIITVVVIIIIK